MSDSLALDIGETIQCASINPAPSPAHDINPSTAASKKQPAYFSPHVARPDSSLDEYTYDDEIDEEEDEDDDIPYSVIRPIPRQANFPPLPDLRFEQSYLSSIARAETKWAVAYITIRDQVMIPLVQGMVWTLILHGWKHWNRTARVSGNTMGARIRRWWYKTNNWSLNSVRNVNKDGKFTRDFGEHYQNQNTGY